MTENREWKEWNGEWSEAGPDYILPEEYPISMSLHIADRRLEITYNNEKTRVIEPGEFCEWHVIEGSQGVNGRKHHLIFTYLPTEDMDTTRKPGWHPSEKPGQLRWYDGNAWSDHYTPSPDTPKERVDVSIIND